MPEQLQLPLSVPGPKLKQLWSPDDIYDNLNAELLLEFSEDRRVERKGRSVGARALGEYLSMWSNTQPHGGLIFVGVENNGDISGCSGIDQKHKNELENPSVFCEDARWSSKLVKVKNNKGNEDFIIAFRVFYRADKLVETTSGDAFMREGDKKIKIHEELKRELRISKGEIHYELESVPLGYPEDFDTKEIEKFCRLYALHRNFKQEKSNEDLLVLAKLGKYLNGTFRPNLACCLLLAKDPRLVIPGARIRLIRYEGTTEKFGDEQNSVLSEFIDGPIPQMLDLAKEKITSQMRYYQRLAPSGRFERRPEYPEAAWFEAIVNAVAHRSYNFKTQNIFVKIFDDRMVVESPGGFVPPTTAETVYDAHNPRNPYLMEAMMHLDLTFCGFEGTRRMRQAMVSAQLPAPKFIQVDANGYKISVILENDRAARNAFADVIAQTITEQVYESLTKEERIIVRYLSSNPMIDVKTAAIETERSKPTAEKILLHLVEKEIIEPSRKGGELIRRPKSYNLKGAKT